MQTLVQLLPSPQEMGTCTVKQPMDLTKGWQKHLSITGGYQLLYQDIYIGKVSIITGPQGSGIMGNNDPGQKPTYEVKFPGAANPIGYLKLDEIKGIIKFIHHLEQERMVYSDKD